MPRFKIVFEVQAQDKDGLVVEKSQTYVELSVEELAGPDLAEATLLAAAGETKLNDCLEYRAANQVSETFEASGLLIARFIELKMREWAKSNPS